VYVLRHGWLTFPHILQLFKLSVNVEEREGRDIEGHEKFLSRLTSFEADLTLLLAAVHCRPDGVELLTDELDRLCEFILCKENEERWKQWGSREDIKQCSEKIREISAHSLCLVEKMKALRTYTEQRDANLYFSLLSAAVKEEKEYVCMGPNAKVLFIGAGAFPVSALTMARETSAEVLCTDIDGEAIRHGNKLAQFLGLQDSFHYSDSHLRNPEFLAAATHVFIASLVPQKLEIVEELTAYVSSDCKIVVRYGNGLRSLFNYPLDVGLLSDWEVKSLRRDRCIYDTIILEHQKNVAGSAV